MIFRNINHALLYSAIISYLTRCRFYSYRFSTLQHDTDSVIVLYISLQRVHSIMVYFPIDGLTKDYISYNRPHIGERKHL